MNGLSCCDEIIQMEKLLRESKDNLLDERLYQKLTEEFNRSPTRKGDQALEKIQVERWFKRRKRSDTDSTDSHNSSKALVNATNTHLPSNPAPESSSDVPVKALGNATNSHLFCNPAPESSSEVTGKALVNATNTHFSSNPAPQSSSEVPGKALVHATNTHLSSDRSPESSSEVPDKGEENSEQEDQLEFEAKSSSDHAWYDVAEFLEHRILNSGEPEVKVRFHDFGCEEDEWVNIKKCVRQRSVPLEPDECVKVEVGSVLLVFREKGEDAQYFDGHVLEIQRKVHDIRGCRCVFTIQYDHDLTEERVPLRRLCRTPKFRPMRGKFLVN